MSNGGTLLTVNNLTYLQNGPYSFKLRENEILGLTGDSGIGKTQLLRALVEVIVYGGKIWLENSLSSSFSAPEWRKKVALVPADSVWWRDTVGEHFPVDGHRYRNNGWLERLGFDEEVLDWRVSRLSTGERQRLALVRALMNKPLILLLDEPCSSLDESSTKKMEDVLTEYSNRNKTALIWVSHDLEQLKRVATRSYRVTRNGLKALSCLNS